MEHAIDSLGSLLSGTESEMIPLTFQVCVVLDCSWSPISCMRLCLASTASTAGVGSRGVQKVKGIVCGHEVERYTDPGAGCIPHLPGKQRIFRLD